MSSHDSEILDCINWQRITKTYQEDFGMTRAAMKTHLSKIQKSAIDAGAFYLTQPLTRYNRGQVDKIQFFHMKLAIEDFEQNPYQNAHRLMQLYSLVLKSKHPINISFAKSTEWFMYNYLMHSQSLADSLLTQQKQEKSDKLQKRKMGIFVPKRMTLIKHADILLEAFCKKVITEREKLNDFKQTKDKCAIN